MTFSTLLDLTGPTKKYFYDNVNTGRGRDNGTYLYMTQTFVKEKMMLRFMKTKKYLVLQHLLLQQHLNCGNKTGGNLATSCHYVCNDKWGGMWP